MPCYWPASTIPSLGLTLVARPAYSYRLNAAFEDHAKRQHMTYVTQHAELDRVRFISELGDVCGLVETVADLRRQIGHDERVHKLESLHEAAPAA